MEARVAKLKSDVGHIRSDVSVIRATLARLAPKIDEMHGKLPYFATREDTANLRAEIEKRPTRRQTLGDIATTVALIGGLLTIGAKLTH